MNENVKRELKAIDRMEEMADIAVSWDIKEQLIKTKNKEIKSSMKNYMTVLREDPLLKNCIRFNILLQRVEIAKPLWWNKEPEPMTDTAENFLYLYFEQYYGLESEKNMRKALDAEAHDKAYHPVVEYLEGLKWDGKPRIRFALKKYLGADDSDLVYECLKHFMLGAIIRAHQPGAKFDEMLCLVGSQGAGKSSFFKFLAVNEEWFTDDIRKLNNEKVFEKLQGFWIVEMSEPVAMISAKSLEDIKSFLSRTKDVYLAAYAHNPESRPRQCIFAGTSNDPQFLPFDRTGSRRFLPIEVDAEKAEMHILDDEEEVKAYFDQMWAEAYQIYKTADDKNRLLKFSKEISEQIEENRKRFMQEDTRIGMLQAWVDDYDGDYVCSIQIWDEVFAGTSNSAPGQYETNEICQIMNTCIEGWKYHGMHRFTKEGYGTQRSWIRIGSID